MRGRRQVLRRVWAVAVRAPAPVQQPERPELVHYRRYTQALLRRYLRMSTEAGRVSSLMGREMFRGNVTRCKVRSFEDVVIFCHDVERRLAQLAPQDRELVKRLALQEYTLLETAGLLGLDLNRVARRYVVVLDSLTGMFLKDGLLEVQE
jgi:hypothetical protein